MAFKYTVLPTFGFTYGSAWNMSRSGAFLVGDSSDADVSTHAYRWSEAGGLLAVGPSIEGHQEVARAVSYDGSVVVGNSSSTTNVFRWVNGVTTTFTKPTGTNSASLFDISDDGSIAVGAAPKTSPTNTYMAIKLASAGVSELPGKLAVDSHYANRVSPNGQFMTGWAGVNSSSPRAVRWADGGDTIEYLDSVIEGAGRGVSDNGVVVGNAKFDGTNTHAFRWTAAGGMVDLGTLGGAESNCSYVSSDGSVVAGNARDTGGVMQAYRWTAAGGMVSLGIADGIGSFVAGLSPDGATIYGSIGYPNDVERPFIWTQADGMVVAPAYSEPSTGLYIYFAYEGCWGGDFYDALGDTYAIFVQIVPDEPFWTGLTNAQETV